MQNMVQLIQLNNIRGLGGLLWQKNPPYGDDHKHGVVKDRSQAYNPQMTDGLKGTHIHEDWGKKIEDEDWK